MNTRNKAYLILFLILVLLVAEIPIQNWIDHFNEKKEIIQTNPFATLPPTEYLAEYLSTFILGGFKPFIVDYLWMKADKLREDKQYYEVKALLSMIARLQPRFTQVWTYNAWNMAYNISRQETDPKLKWRWVKEALEYLEEGYLRNPHSYTLANDLAFIYYHRIPQESVLMEWCERDTGTDCYVSATKWFTRAMEIAKEKKRSSYGYAVMYLSSRYLHSFELLKKGKFEEAVTELTNCSAFARDYLAQTYKYDAARWLRDTDDFLELKNIFAQERVLFMHKLNNDSAQYWAQWERVLNQYKQLIHSRVGLNFDPLNIRVETLLLEYLKHGYTLLEQNKYRESVDRIQYLVKYSAELIPNNPSDHPDRWFFSKLAQRFKELSTIIETEVKLLESYHSGNPATTQYLNQTMELYKTYLKKQGDLEWFNLDVERRRAEYLKTLVK